ncbi:hypothetical protein [Ilyobacter sp.]|uniref:hypothetical protein n=1 Tax=Ilyobacter sp. TaxID=3100343 RepID=UPI0035675EF2
MRKGLSVIESVVAVAILAIVMLMMSPMVKNYSLVYDRINLQNRIDYEFGKTLEIIKRKVKASRVDDDYVDSAGDSVKAVEVLTAYTGIYDNIISELRLLVPNDDNDPDKNYIAFRIIEDKTTDSDGDGINDRSLVYITNPGEDSSISSEKETKTVLIEYIDAIDTSEKYFQYKKGVVLIYLDLDIDRMTGESIEGKRNILDKIRDSAVTRINLDMSNNF